MTLFHQILPHLRDPEGPDVKGNYTAWCDFHPDGQGKPPHRKNLSIHPERGFICHACGAKGGLRKLADHYGIGEKKIVATYDYQDESGQILFQVIRYEPKGFSQRRPDGNGGYVYNLDGVRRVLYRLPELLARSEEVVHIVEGEKDVETLRSMGLLATTNPGGAGKWLDEYTGVLRDREVVILPDLDSAGRRHAQLVRRKLEGIAKNVKIVELPGPEKDITEWVEAGHTREELLALIEGPGAGDVDPGEDDAELDDVEGNEGTEATRRESQADLIVSLAEKAGTLLFHTPDGDGFMAIPKSGHWEYWPLKSRQAKRWLARLVYEAFKKAPSTQSLNDALSVLEGRAYFDSPEKAVFVRVSGDEKAIYIDLGNEKWEVVKVTSDGWEVVQDTPICFRRAKGMTALPQPERGGKVTDLQPFVNLQTEDDWVLMIAWLLGALFPRGPYPVLVLGGSHGSSKSTLARILRKLSDPNTAEIRALPRNDHELVISAVNSRVQVFDNVSFLPDWLSDALCRLATGGGFAARELYTDAEEVVFDAQRPVILNGIEEIVTRGDLLDRAILLSLARISDERRRPEKEFWAAFSKAWPRVFGALLDILSAALRKLPDTVLVASPRMADFALLATAAEEALGWKPGTFMKAYAGNQAAGNDSVLEASPVAPLILEMAKEEGWMWRGCAKELLTILNATTDEAQKRSKGWPKSPLALSNHLRRLAANLTQAGIEVTTGERERGHERKRLITIRRMSQPGGQAAELGDGLSRTTVGRTETQSSGSSGGSSDGFPRESDASDASDDPLRTFTFAQERPVADGGDRVRVTV